MDFEKAKEAIAGFTDQAEQLIKDPGKLESLLQQFEAKIKELPVAGDALSRVPLMISMIRSYITKEYTAVSPKVIATLVAAIIYLLKGKDLIPDNIPVVGYADDIAVFAAAFLIDEPELSYHPAWQMDYLKNLRSIAELGSYQFILATHSAQIFDYRWSYTIDLYKQTTDDAEGIEENNRPD